MSRDPESTIGDLEAATLGTVALVLLLTFTLGLVLAFVILDTVLSCWNFLFNKNPKTT